MKAITKFDKIEFILNTIPEALPYLMKKGVCGLSCGEPTLGILEETAKAKGFTDAEIDLFVDDLNILLIKQQKEPAL